MFGIIAKVAAVAVGVGFGAGVITHRKAGKVKEDVKERFTKTTTEIIHVRVPKGTDLDKCRVETKVIIPEYEDGAMFIED